MNIMRNNRAAIAALSLLAAPVIASPESSGYQPGLNGGANAAKRGGDGFVAAVIYNNYRTNAVDNAGNTVGPELDVYSLFNSLSYNTRYSVLGAKYSLGVVVPVGSVNIGNQSTSANGDFLEVGEPVLMPAQLYWQGEDLNVTARYYYRHASTRSVLDKSYNTHQLMTAATYDLSSSWQLNAAVAYEAREKDVRSGYDLRPGDIYTLDVSAVYKMDNGVNIGLLGYQLENLTRDMGASSSRDHQGRVTGLGFEVALPLQAVPAAISLRVFNEFNARNSTHGTRMFLAYGHQF